MDSFENRFWERVAKGEPHECWLWAGVSKTKGGHYGRMSYTDGRKITSHRLAWMLTNGDIPKGQWILHNCGVSLCCNPDHLKLGKAKENADDRSRHARERGEQSWWHAKNPRPPKIAPEVIEQMRKLREQGTSTWQIAELVGVSRRTAWNYTKI